MRADRLNRALRSPWFSGVSRARSALGPGLVLALGLCAAALGGCRRARPIDAPTNVLVVPPAEAMALQNLRSQAIAAIWVKPCGSASSAYRIVEGLSVPAGSTAMLPLDRLPACVDLSARDSHGDSVGEQADLRVSPGARWTIE